MTSATHGRYTPNPRKHERSLVSANLLSIERVRSHRKVATRSCCTCKEIVTSKQACPAGVIGPPPTVAVCLRSCYARDSHGKSMSSGRRGCDHPEKRKGTAREKKGLTRCWLMVFSGWSSGIRGISGRL